jgi:hypothetical protein
MEINPGGSEGKATEGSSRPEDASIGRVAQVGTALDGRARRPERAGGELRNAEISPELPRS